MIKRLLVVVLVLISVTISAQRNNASPYSAFGIGENFKLKTVEQASMGGIGVAMKDLNHLNFVNPAAVADLRFATYSLGGEVSFLTLKEANASQSGNSTSLQYIALGFPIGSKAGFSTGIQPLSSVGYSLINEIKDTNENILEVTRFKGTGGTSRLYANFGTYVFKGFSLGAEAAFVFGTIDRSILNQQAEIATATKYQEETSVRGAEYKLGAQYKTKLSKDLQFNSGLAVKFSNDFTQKGTQRMYNLTFSGSGFEQPRDTLFNKPFSTDVNSPLQTIVGFGLGKENKWYVGINSEFQKALEASENGFGNNFAYEDAMRTSIGGYYIPKINSISSYWNRVIYRAGLRFENTGLLINTGASTSPNFTSIKDFGINIGLGLPLPRQLSNLNLGLEYGQKGTTNNNLIKENYFNVRLSLSLNSLDWFKKREID